MIVENLGLRIRSFESTSPKPIFEQLQHIDEGNPSIRFDEWRLDKIAISWHFLKVFVAVLKLVVANSLSVLRINTCSCKDVLLYCNIISAENKLAMFW